MSFSWPNINYYQDVDLPRWADYMHNPDTLDPKVEAHGGPVHSWVLDVMLAFPDE